MKEIRLCIWRTKHLNIDGTNLTNAQCANIGDQVKFIDTIKYCKKYLASLAKNANVFEKANIRQSCRKIIENDFESFDFLTDEIKDWVLLYLSDGKGMVSYEKLRSYKDVETRKWTFFQVWTLQLAKKRNNKRGGAQKGKKSFGRFFTSKNFQSWTKYTIFRTLYNHWAN